MSIDLHIERDRDAWVGTFAIVARTLVEDVLSDGQPFYAVIVAEREDGSVVERTVRVVGQDAGAGHIVLDDGDTIDHEDILSLGVIS